MERLTCHKGTDDHSYFVKCFHTCPHAYPDDYCRVCFQKLIDIVSDYEDAEEQGLLIKLPVKVGDELFRVDEKWSRNNPRIVQAVVKRCEVYDDSNVWFDIEIGDWVAYTIRIHSSLIGDKWFKTREEAENKLKELEDSNADLSL